jgi:hypothetical protein
VTSPIVIDLYCGLGGWSEGFLSEGYECHGYDIEAHDYGTGGYPGTLHLRDILTIHGSEFKDATIIVGSSPCQKYSYMAMPWTKAKDMGRFYGDVEHPERIAELNALFDAQFRIQREASEAAGRWIPMIVENVRGAQKWVGPAKYNYGSFYLWGDVPALMPCSFNVRTSKTPPGNGAGAPLWKDRKMNSVSHATMTKENMEWYGIETEGIKQGGDWFGKNCESSMSRLYGSKSPKRKMASAMIAKIPFPLAQHIARTFKPQMEVVA